MHHWESISATLGGSASASRRSFASAEALLVHYLLAHPQPLPIVSALLWTLKAEMRRRERRPVSRGGHLRGRGSSSSDGPKHRTQ